MFLINDYKWFLTIAFFVLTVAVWIDIEYHNQHKHRKCSINSKQKEIAIIARNLKRNKNKEKTYRQLQMKINELYNLSPHSAYVARNRYLTRN